MLVGSTVLDASHFLSALSYIRTDLLNFNSQLPLIIKGVCGQAGFLLNLQKLGVKKVALFLKVVFF